jgi:lipoprotein-anchoring transpeptidase ErfK/SrfK
MLVMGMGAERLPVCINRLIAMLSAAIFAVLVLGQQARADLLIKIDKTAQHMTVTVDGKQLYDWPVSTGGGGYDTPSGSFKPFRMEIDHRSDEWDDAPMPYSIFFTKIGHAIHGTNEQRNLGRPVSHGCVRLSVKNAATLWELVKRQKMANTTVVLNGTIPNAGPPAVARSRPMPLTTDGPSDDASLPQDQPRYDDNRPPLPFPFSIFGR